VGLPPDSELVPRLRAGDAEAFALVVDAWSPAMLHVARSYVSGLSSAEDVVQEAWIGVIRGLDRFEGRASLRTWVFRILMNLARKRGVADHRVQPVGDAGEVDAARFGPDGHWMSPPLAWDTDPAGRLSALETRAVVDAALAGLPERQRTVVTLRDVEGLTSEEVAEVLGISAGNQRVLLHRGRSVVRAALEQHFAEASS
jgi:RNA polymerase sigma-70 factor (ECF subfamily)